MINSHNPHFRGGAETGPRAAIAKGGMREFQNPNVK